MVNLVDSTPPTQKLDADGSGHRIDPPCAPKAKTEGGGFPAPRPEATHMVLDVVDGGDGIPPEPNWRLIFGRKGDRDAAAEYWRSLISELRTAEKLSAANAHSIKRLVVTYVTYDISAKEVLRMGPVMLAKRTRVPTYNPWWTTMSNAASQAAGLEKELCISPRERGAGAKVERKARKTTGAASYLKPVAK